MKREHEKLYIYGKHALTEALMNAPQTVQKVFLSPEVRDGELRAMLSKHQIPVADLKTREVSRMVGHDASHQGVIATVNAGRLSIPFDAFIDSMRPTETTMLVLLDELTDPQNVGAIIRSAAAFGAAGVLMPEHNQAPITGAVVKASAGMVFRVPIVSIGNVNYTIDTLKKEGFRVCGLAMSGSRDISDESFDAPTLFIVGNEGRGIREKTLERCDVHLRIPMHPRCESLNASVSVAVVLHQWSSRHPEALR